MMGTIALAGTLDTKGREHAFVADLIRKRGHQTLLIDVGTLEPPGVQPDITRDEVARLGGVDLKSIAERKDRGEAVTAMANALAVVVKQLQEEGKIDGIISLGGGGGTAIATSGMRALPIGFPKLMVSTLASGNTAHYVGDKDIVMMPSIVDVAGINRISRKILTRAAGAICGMVEQTIEEAEDKPLIAASMFGNTTQCVQSAKAALEQQGFEVVVFAATGTGGRSMESLIESGLVGGVLDITTTEWADELVGGVLNAGPHRLEAAGKMNLPTVLAPGCIDMVNFGEPQTIPESFKDRTFYQHNPQVTLMRTTTEECRKLGTIFADKLNAYESPVVVLIPKRGFSVIGAPGQPFHNEEADQAFTSALKAALKPSISVKEMDCNINDPAFAEACATELSRLMAKA